MTKSIVVVKMPCKISFLIIKSLSSWPSLISDVLDACNLASDWPHTFLQLGCFCLGCKLHKHYARIILYYVLHIEI